MYLAFQTSVVQTYLVRQIANHFSERLNTRITLASVDIRFFNQVVLNEFLIEDQQQDTLFYVDKMVASIDDLKIKRKLINLSSIEMSKTKFFVSLTEDQLPNYKFIFDAMRSNKQQDNWDFFCQNFLFNDTRLGYSYYKMEKPKTIDLYDIQLDVSDFELHHDSLSFSINNMSFDDHKSFQLSSLSTQLVSSNHVVKLQNLNVSTPHSSIGNADVTLDQSEMGAGRDFSFLKLDVDLKESVVDFVDVSQLVPSLRGMDLKIDLSGRVYGTIADLKAKDLQLSMGQNTRLICDLYSNGLPDLDQTYILLDLKNSTADFKDLSKIKLPDSMDADFLEFPELLYDAGVVRYEGNFTGFLSDFVAYGSVQSNFGQIKTDLSFVPQKGNRLKVNGSLRTVNFELGEFTQINQFEQLTFNGKVDGSFNQVTRAFDVAVAGVVDSLVFNQYKFKNLSLDGALQDKKFEGSFNIQDPNLDANFVGKLDFNKDIPEFDFEMKLGQANLKALNIDHRYEKSMLSMFLNANFKANSIDNLDGNIWVEEGQYVNENDTLLLNSFSVNTFYEDSAYLQIRSDFADAEITGNYSFRTIVGSVKNLLHRYLPSSGLAFDETKSLNQFNFKVMVKDVDPITRTLLPQLYIGPSTIAGRFDDQQLHLDFHADIPDMKYGNLIFNGYSLRIHSNDELEIKSRLEELMINDKQRIYNLAFLANAADDRLDSKIVWNNFHETTYSGELETQIDFQSTGYDQTHVEIAVKPSNIYIADTLWTVHPSAVTIDSSRIAVDNFRISNKQQQLTVDGVVSKDKADRLNLKVNEINLGNLNSFAQKDVAVRGVLNGSASLFDVYERAMLLSDLKIDDLSFRNHAIGDVSLVSKWDRPSEELQAELSVNTKNHQSLYGFGSYKPGNDSIDFSVRLNDLSLTILQPILQNSFQNVRGRGTGEVWIHGTPKKLLLDGDVLGLDAGLAVKSMQVDYYFSDTVSFRSDSIIFDQIQINDYQGNKGVFDGSIRHDNFQNMDYDLEISSPRLLAMNTTFRDNERFYGKAYARGSFQVRGHGKDVLLTSAASSLSGTSINISLDYEEEAQEYDFINFVNRERINISSPIAKSQNQKSNLQMNFDFNVTSDAQVQLIYNSQIGDVIRSRGTGDLLVRIDPDFNITMFGEYRVEQGDYLFTLQNVINKKFEIAHGGTIHWNGDPYDATIDLEAIYRLKTSLAELFVDAGGTVDYNQRVPVTCGIFLTENLSNPEIAFDINFPTVEDQIKDQVQQFFSTDEDMNRQILSLLVLGRFYTPDHLRGSYQATNPNLVGSTASELFSNQLSNWLSQISNDFDIGVNYRPGNQISDDEIELALSTQIFNDRVTLNGNIGNNSTANAARSNNSNIVGDFDLNVKLTNNGKLQLKAYNHSNDNLLYETSPYTQGIGVSYRENYNNLGELWRKLKRLFVKRDEE
ncbi:translocation/assembly module TamB domain-containing protein [Sunxiuqinia rutila]|uniref:translocation/assembly module TamB domain-containing protein n=1 Tax=Sunxiuqinia rutila TaxID=1397841 RepID=UPI003D36211C